MESTLLSGLLDISKVSPVSEKDAALFEELASVLKKHGAEKRFGVTLLHKHFDVAPDEVMLESTDVASRTQTIKPVKKREVGKMPVIETSWRLDTGKPIMDCVCKDAGGGHQHVHRH